MGKRRKELLAVVAAAGSSPISDEHWATFSAKDRHFVARYRATSSKVQQVSVVDAVIPSVVARRGAQLWQEVRSLTWAETVRLGASTRHGATVAHARVTKGVQLEGVHHEAHREMLRVAESVQHLQSEARDRLAASIAAAHAEYRARIEPLNAQLAAAEAASVFLAELARKADDEWGKATREFAAIRNAFAATMSVVHDDESVAVLVLRHNCMLCLGAYHSRQAMMACHAACYVRQAERVKRAALETGLEDNAHAFRHFRKILSAASQKAPQGVNKSLSAQETVKQSTMEDTDNATVDPAPCAAAAEEVEAQRVRAAEEEAQRVRAAEEEAQRARAAEEEAQRVRAAAEVEEAQRVRAAEEEAQRVHAAAEVEAQRVRAAEEEAQRVRAAAEVEAQRVRAAEEEAQRVQAAVVELELALADAARQAAHEEYIASATAAAFEALEEQRASVVTQEDDDVSLYSCHSREMPTAPAARKAELNKGTKKILPRRPTGARTSKPRLAPPATRLAAHKGPSATVPPIRDPSSTPSAAADAPVPKPNPGDQPAKRLRYAHTVLLPPQRLLVNDGNDCHTLAALQLLQLLPLPTDELAAAQQEGGLLGATATALMNLKRTEGGAPMTLGALRYQLRRRESSLSLAGPEDAVEILGLLGEALQGLRLEFRSQESSQSRCSTCHTITNVQSWSVVHHLRGLISPLEELTLGCPAPPTKSNCAHCSGADTVETTEGFRIGGHFVFLTAYNVESGEAQSCSPTLRIGTANYAVIGAIERIERSKTTAHYVAHMSTRQGWVTVDDSVTRPMKGPLRASCVLAAHTTTLSSLREWQHLCAPPPSETSPSPSRRSRCEPVPEQPHHPDPQPALPENPSGSHRSMGRGGEGNLASAGDVEENPGPPPVPPLDENRAATDPFAAAPQHVIAPLFDGDDGFCPFLSEKELLLGRQEVAPPPQPTARLPCCKDGREDKRGPHSANCILFHGRTHAAARANPELLTRHRRSVLERGGVLERRSYAAVDVASCSEDDMSEPSPLTEVTSFAPPIDLGWLWSLDLVPVKNVPRLARSQVGSSLSHACGKGNREERFWRALSFGRLVLTHRSKCVDVKSGLVERAGWFQRGEWELLRRSATDEDAVRRSEAAAKLRSDEFSPVEPPSKRSLYDLPDEASPAPSAEKVARCIKLVKEGCVSQGNASLSEPAIAAWTPATVAAMESKHPKALHSGITKSQRAALAECPAPQPVSASDTVRFLRQFPPGSGAGPSCLAPAALMQLATFPGSPLRSTLPEILTMVVSGDVPPAMARYMFGAKLVPLIKKDKALRPIACSETFRRLGAKVLASRLSAKFRELLTAEGQIGVAVSSGLEALVGWTRRSALLMGDDEVIAKVDFANAFNSVSRRSIADAVLRLVPELGRYVLGCYGAHSLLFCGTSTISSEVGAQQGDPLGPVLFSLAALSCTSLPADLRAKLRGTGWYLDDGLLMGKAEHVHAALVHIRDAGQKIGLHMNVAKTEVLPLAPSAWDAHATEFPCIRPMASLELLGLPCSPDRAGLDAYVERFSQRLSARTTAVTEVAKADPHVGYLLLRMCTGFSASVHLARAQGPLPAFDRVDDETIRAMDAIVPLDERCRSLAELPFRHGGLGLRAMRRHAAAAFAAASLETAAHMRIFSPEPLPEDPLLAAVLLQLPPEVAPLYHAKLVAIPPHRPIRKVQREFSQAIDDARFSELAPTGDDLVRARSCGARGASLYLCGPLSHDERLSEYFFDANVFATAIRLRLGMAVIPDAPRTCHLCNRAQVDELGHHAAKCMTSGARTYAHNALRDTLADIMRDALLTPTVEPITFADTKKRADILFRCSGESHLIDIAITHPIDTTYAAHAALVSGGAATSYEGTKHAKYAADLKGTNLRFGAFVVESYGALGHSAVELLSQIVVPHYRRRLGLSPPVASRIVFGRVTSVVIKRISMIATLA